MPKEIEELARGIMKDPVHVEVAPQGTTAAEIKQSVVLARLKQKRKVLSDMLADEAMSSVIVFARTKHGADRVVRDLERDGFKAAVIHGNKSQNARQKALNGFRDGSVRILVATDIAARGIDVPGISHVVNFDLPDEAEELRPPHRPHRPQRRRRHCDHAGRSVGRLQAAPGRADYPHEAADRGRPYRPARSGPACRRAQAHARPGERPRRAEARAQAASPRPGPKRQDGQGAEHRAGGEPQRDGRSRARLWPQAQHAGAPEGNRPGKPGGNKPFRGKRRSFGSGRKPARAA